MLDKCPRCGGTADEKQACGGCGLPVMFWEEWAQLMEAIAARFGRREGCQVGKQDAPLLPSPPVEWKEVAGGARKGLEERMDELEGDAEDMDRWMDALEERMDRYESKEISLGQSWAILATCVVGMVVIVIVCWLL